MLAEVAIGIWEQTEKLDFQRDQVLWGYLRNPQAVLEYDKNHIVYYGENNKY